MSACPALRFALQLEPDPPKLKRVLLRVFPALPHHDSSALRLGLRSRASGRKGAREDDGSSLV